MSRTYPRELRYSLDAAIKFYRNTRLFLDLPFNLVILPYAHPVSVGGGVETKTDPSKPTDNNFNGYRV